MTGNLNMAPRLQTLEDFIKNLSIETDDPSPLGAQFDHIRTKLIEYVSAITSESELRLDPEVDEIIHGAQLKAIILKATYLTEIALPFEKGNIDVTNAKCAFGNAP